MATELGVTVKTIYNWISVGKLEMVEPGYVDHVEAYEVWLHQQALRSITSYYQSVNAVRDSLGRWSKEGPSV